jgi:hypothetical protein
MVWRWKPVAFFQIRSGHYPRHKWAVWGVFCRIYGRSWIGTVDLKMRMQKVGAFARRLEIDSRSGTAACDCRSYRSCHGRIYKRYRSVFIGQRN